MSSQNLVPADHLQDRFFSLVDTAIELCIPFLCSRKFTIILFVCMMDVHYDLCVEAGPTLPSLNAWRRNGVYESKSEKGDHVIINSKSEKC